MRHPRDVSSHLPLSRLNSFVMEPSSTDACRPAFPDDRTESAISCTVGRAAAERGATFPSVATAQVAKPRYDSSQPNVTYGSPSVQWSGPSLYDYAWGVTWVTERQESYLELPSGQTPKPKKVRNESWAGCSTMSDV